MNINSLILAILNFNEATGYEIKKLSTDGQFSHFVDVSYGSIYPALARLEKEEMVTCRFESQQGKPDRKVYSITDKGRQEFIASLSQPPAQDKFKSEFLLVAMNAELTTVETLERAIDARIAYLNEKLNMLNGLLEECENEGTRWVANYGAHCMNCDLTYLNQNKASLIELAGRLLHPPKVEAAE